MPQADVVIVNWNAGDYLRRCLASIAALSQMERDRIRSVVVVDNASTDGSVEGLPLDAFIMKLVRNSANKGFAAACNQGASFAQAEFILFLNPDTIVLEGSISRSITFLADVRQASLGICGIQLLDDSGTNARSCSRFPTTGRVILHAVGLDRLFPSVFPTMSMREWDHSQTRVVDQVIGAFYLVRRSLFEALLGFDERFFVYYEEVDFSLRARAAGFGSVYLTSAQAIHSGGGSSRGVKARALFYNLRSRLLYIHKHFQVPGIFIAGAFTLLVEPFCRVAHAVLTASAVQLLNTLSAFSRLYGYLLGRLLWRH